MNKDNPIFEGMRNIGSFTKGAIRNFENSIVSQKDYLEKEKKAHKDKPEENNH